MNVQTEKLDNHIARLTVEVESERLEKTMQQAARKLSQRVNIPGFRKGKAPLSVITRYVGQAALLEEAMETLGNEVYKAALDEAKLDPYASGSLEDFSAEPQPKFIFTVPLQPTYDLAEYTAVRVPYTQPEVTDKDVNDALERLREQYAVVEDTSRPFAKGNQIIADVYATYITDETPADFVPDHDSADQFVHMHDRSMIVDDTREIAPGFADALVGANAGDERVFDLTYPDDAEKHGESAGRTGRFVVKLEKVQNVTLPELNDTFAARVSENEPPQAEGGEGPLTLLQLRIRVRETLEADLKAQVEGNYVTQVVDKMREGATFAYPDAMVHDQIDDMINETAERLRMKADDYLRVTNQNRDELYVSLRETAARNIERTLVLRGILEAENLEVTDADVEAEIDRTAEQFGEQAAIYRQLLGSKDMRDSIRSSVLEQRVRQRVAAIGKGEAN